MKPMTLKANKDKITFGFETNWENNLTKNITQTAVARL